MAKHDLELADVINVNKRNGFATAGVTAAVTERKILQQSPIISFVRSAH